MVQERPIFSIIVPTYSRPGPLRACLRSLVSLNYPREHFEVIIVDDGGEAPLETLIASFSNRLKVSLLRQQHSGPATARNTGAARAEGKFLAFIDDDCAPAPNWLWALAARFAKSPDCAIGGRTLNAIPSNPYSTASQMLIDYLYAYYNLIPNKKAHFFASNNLALPADRFRAIRGFDTTFPLAAGEDREFCDRWLQHGYRLVYAPEALVYHAHRLTLRTFFRQHFNYGRGAHHFHKARMRRSQRGICVEPVSFYLNLLRHPFSQVSKWQALTLAVLLAVSQEAAATGFFWESLSQAVTKTH